MRRVKGENGAVAVLVALLSTVLFAFAALVIDVGALYSERRQLQTGADAAALAVAQACAGGSCGAFRADADAFADDNALDLAARVPQGGVCGTPSVGLPACVDPPSGLAGAGYVRVDSRTEQVGGSSLVPPLLAQVLDPSYAGTEVGARATVVWGPPASIEARLAITFSECELRALTTDADGNEVYASPPYDPALERVVFFHDTTQASHCPAGPSGADLPGGFGWLDVEDDCTARVEQGWATAAAGAAASQDCKEALEALVGRTVLIPVFDRTNGLSGTNGSYHIVSYSAFVLTGWRFPGTSHASSYRTGGRNPCSNAQTCLSGFFVDVVVPSAGPVGDGPDRGVRTIQLVS